MRGQLKRLVMLAGLSLVALPLGGCSYNTFVGQEEAIKAQWAQVENQLQRRNDLIPNLVATVQGTAAQEQTVFKDDRRLAREAGRREDARREDGRGQPADGGALATARHRRELPAL